jgi:hypothetical protein
MFWAVHGVPLHRVDHFGMIVILSPTAAAHHDMDQTGRPGRSNFWNFFRENIQVFTTIFRRVSA